MCIRTYIYALNISEVISMCVKMYEGDGEPKLCMFVSVCRSRLAQLASIQRLLYSIQHMLIKVMIKIRIVLVF